MTLQSQAHAKSSGHQIRYGCVVYIEYTLLFIDSEYQIFTVYRQLRTIIDLIDLSIDGGNLNTPLRACCASE